MPVAITPTLAAMMVDVRIDGVVVKDMIIQELVGTVVSLQTM